MTEDETGDAEVFTVNVQVGKETLITAFGTFTGAPPHHVTPPQIWVSEPPKNGVTNTRQVKVTGPCYGQRSKPCTEQQSNGYGMYYQPEPGFRGAVRLRVDVSWPPTAMLLVQIITVHVK